MSQGPDLSLLAAPLPRDEAFTRKLRGEIRAGLKADINIVDLQGLKLPMPQIVRDLPSGARRVVQRSQGYVATLVSGQAVVENGAVTAARPGRWTRAANR